MQKLMALFLALISPVVVAKSFTTENISGFIFNYSAPAGYGGVLSSERNIHEVVLSYYDNRIKVFSRPKDATLPLYEVFLSAENGEPLQVGKVYEADNNNTYKPQLQFTPIAGYNAKSKYVIRELKVNKYHEITSLALDCVSAPDFDPRGWHYYGSLRFNSTVPVNLGPQASYNKDNHILHVPIFIPKSFSEIKQLDFEMINQAPLTFQLKNIGDVTSPVNVFTPPASSYTENCTTTVILPQANMGELMNKDDSYLVKLVSIDNYDCGLKEGKKFIIDKAIVIK